MRTYRPDNHADWLRAAFLTDVRHGTPEEMLVETRAVQLRLLAYIPIAIILGLVIAFLGVAWTFQSVALLGIALVIYRWWNRLPVSLGRILGVLVGVVVLYLLTFVYDNRWAAVTFLALVTFIAFEVWGRRPIEFILQMWHADQLPNERVEVRLERSIRHSRFSLCVMLAIILFVPQLHSTSFAIVLLLLFCVASILHQLARSGRPMLWFEESRRAMSRFLTDYLTYPNASAGSVEWQPKDSLAQRRTTFNTLWMLLTLLLAVGLSYSIPWEFFAAHNQPGFVWSFPPGEFSASFAWLTLPFTFAISAKADYRWALIIGFVLSMTLPYLMLWVLYYPAIRKLHLLFVVANAVREHDERSDFEIDQERMAQSEGVDTTGH